MSRAGLVKSVRGVLGDLGTVTLVRRRRGRQELGRRDTVSDTFRVWCIVIGDLIWELSWEMCVLG